MADDDLIGIRGMRAAFGVTARTLRHYEDKGLLSPARRGETRLYGRRDRARLSLILRGRRFGFGLEEIAELLSLYDLGDGQARQLAETLARAEARRAALAARRDDLDAVIGELDEQIALVRGRLAGLGAAPPAALNGTGRGP
jgi:DNA-binding transcriptional MerR regulator